ncbi:nuclear transport factor 2 family protein [Pseudonocardia sp. GCM10023141]|uniref:nuclear transport factor 2 family protein n=1 Tax=Pseudonocardia sp. GCM10023141 TaxID=3252653 RepID=UPI0036181B82
MQDIRDVLSRYCRAVDRLDAALLDSVYHPDAVEHHGYFTGPATDYRRQLIARLRDGWEKTQHVLGSSLIEIFGTTAHAETYVVAIQTRHLDAAHEQVVDSFGGRYIDHFELRRGEWRIASRTLVMDWQHTGLGHESVLAGSLTRQRRDRLDAAYGTERPD